MQKITFVIGGCRSGKSGHALALAEQTPGTRTFLATCIPYDDEMKARVINHQRERSPEWQTVEAPLDLPEAIGKQSRQSDILLADCLTLWINNLLMQDTDTEPIQAAIDRLIQSLDDAHCPVILVSNEVGMGIVPENKLARLFRDYAGMVNQRVAEAAHRVIWMVAGVPVPVKG